MPPPDIRIAELSAGYRGHQVLHELSVTIPGGQVTALAGPNGSGKSTLLGVLAGVITPTAGTLSLGHARPAFVVQQSSVPATLPITVHETVAMGRWAHRGAWRRLTRRDRTIVREYLGRMDIADLADRRLDTLSGGQRQRALLAQALAQESGLLLLDEPTTGLDTLAQQEISEAIRRVGDQGVTVVHATHSREDALRADHCLLIRDGRIAAQGDPHTVLHGERTAEPA
ncbi:ABC transporter ATP-binding protein [Nocardia amamiensis]|uniref:ABC transporter ATP-binding protein n=1 Tax=Nocardia amamiensis TaxID=404578 RepID=A0ABS0D0R7_9NOCA|nr:zinc ABC transporter ATP-binding protein AztA [Nocardia amamiensis]MBF6302370.1 ABC transporter ATP-binding protein [Nocardia amamiensis]